MFQGSVFRVQGSCFRVQGLGFRVDVLGFRVYDSGLMFQGSGSRDPQVLAGRYSRVWLRMTRSPSPGSTPSLSPISQSNLISTTNPKPQTKRVREFIDHQTSITGENHH